MDPSSQLTSHLVAAILPPDAAAYINAHILHPHAPLRTYTRAALQQARGALDAVFPLVQPLLDRLLALMADNQGLVGLAVAVAAVTVVLVVLNWLRRLAMWAAWMSVRVVLLAAGVGLAAFVWEQGLFETSRQLVVVSGKIVGYVSVLKSVWVDEYNRYEAQQAMGGRTNR